MRSANSRPGIDMMASTVRMIASSRPPAEEGRGGADHGAGDACPSAVARTARSTVGARAVEDAAEDIAAELVRAQPEFARWARL